MNTKIYLKISLIWNDTILKEEALLKPKMIMIGADAEKTLFAIESDNINIGESFTILEPVNDDYKISFLDGMEGIVKLPDREYSLSEFKKERCIESNSVYTGTIEPFSSGFIDIDDKTLSWSFVNATPLKLGSGLSIDRSFLRYLTIVAILHAVIVLFVGAMKMEGDELTFSDIPDRFANMVIEEVEKEKEEVKKKKIGRKREEIGKRMAGKEGKIGKKDTPKYIMTKIPKARKLIKSKLRSRGVFGALSNGSFGDLTDDSSDVANRLAAADFNGTSGEDFVAGRGSNGANFRGDGTGGGGTGYGRIGGTGDIDTGGGRNTKVSLSKGIRGERKIKVNKKGKVIYNGFCKKSDIQRVVSRRSKTIRYCYSQELHKFRNLKGKVKLMWIIGMSGKVERVRVIEDTIKNNRMNSCLKRQIKRWVFSKPEGGKCKIMYPFIFSVD